MGRIACRCRCRRFKEASSRSGSAAQTGLPLRTAIMIMIEKTVRRLKSPQGQTLIEFAFVLPVILVFFFALVDFGIAIDRRIVLQHAVREGARYGAVHADIDDICQLTADQAQGIIETGDVTVTYPDGSRVGDSVRVQADFTWTFPIMTEMLGAFGVPPLSIDMTPNGTSRLEQTVSGAGACA